MHGLIDIVIPAYNAAGHIDKMLQEIQKLTGIAQVIAVDDCSTDHTIKRLKTWPQVVIIQNEKNAGQHFSTRKGVLFSKSEWVLSLDDDLPVSINSLQQLIQFAVDSESELVYASYPNPRPLLRKIGSVLTTKIMMQRHGISHSGSSTRMMKKSLINKLRTIEAPSRFLDEDLLRMSSSTSFFEVTLNDEMNNTSRYTISKLTKMFGNMLLKR